MSETKEVTSTVDILKGKDDKETIEVEVFETSPVYVKTEYSQSINLGNYNSFELKVGLAVPCYREELNEVSSTVDNWVKNKLNHRVKSVKNNIKGDSNA
jgi:hypothetical protein